MTDRDISGDSRIEVTYLIETPQPIDRVAEAMTNEQSSGTFVDVPGETTKLRECHAARVEATAELETVDRPSLPGAETTADGNGNNTSGSGVSYTRAEVVISFPLRNTGTSLPNLMTTIAGNLYELKPLSGLRLISLNLPDAFAVENPGPGFGIEGTRKIVDVYDRPIIGTIVKPSVGLSPEETAEILEPVVEAGVDFVKDDELIASPPYSPVKERVEAVMDVIDRHERKTGDRVMYACNITGSINEMLERHDAVKDAGGNCVMVSIQSVGLAAVQALRKEAELPIHGHRNGWGMLSRHPQLGWNYEAYQQLWRLAGIDHLHVSGLQNKFTESDASVIQSAKAVQRPIVSSDDIAMPVFSSGQWAIQAPDTYEALGNTDLMYLAGGGILGHPDGPSAGVAHLKQSWKAAIQGIPLEEYATDHDALATALDYYD